MRNPCVVASMPDPFKSWLVVMLHSALPVGDGNRRPEPSDIFCASVSNSSARVDSGTRCSRPDFILSAGMVQTPACRSTSLQVASRASPDRVAVKIVYSSSSFVAVPAADARTLTSAPATA